MVNPCVNAVGTNPLILVAVIVPVLIVVEDIFPEEVSDEAVIPPAAKLPLPSRFTIVFGVFNDVAEFTDDAIVVIVPELTPPILLVTKSVVANVPLVGKVKSVTPVLVSVVV